MRSQIYLCWSFLLTQLWLSPALFASDGALNALPDSTFHVASSFEPEIWDPTYAWIKSMQLDNGLVESAEGSNFVSLYDNALAALVFTQNNDRRSTELILDYFNARLDTEFKEWGGGFYQYRDTKGAHAGRKWIGDNAWLLLAIHHHAERFCSSKYAPMAMALENWFRSLQDTDGGLWGGIQNEGERIHKITEGIITAFNAVKGYNDFHRGILSYLKKNRWDLNEKLLLAWPENPKYRYAMDLHTLGSLIFPSMSEHLLSKVERYNTQQRATATGEEIRGYCFDEDRDVIWLEGTAQMALAFRQSGLESKGRILLNELEKTLTHSSLHESAAGIPFATNPGSSYGSAALWQHADRSPAVSASAWYIFSLRDFNPFQLNSKNNIPSSDLFWLP